MFSKVCSAWLVILVMLPFTAPFSAFNLADLLPGTTHHDRDASPQLPRAAADHTAVSSGAPLPPGFARLRLDLTRLRGPHVVTVSFVTELTYEAASLLDDRHSATRPSVLRI